MMNKKKSYKENSSVEFSSSFSTMRRKKKQLSYFQRPLPVRKSVFSDPLIFFVEKKKHSRALSTVFQMNWQFNFEDFFFFLKCYRLFTAYCYFHGWATEQPITLPSHCIRLNHILCTKSGKTSHEFEIRKI